MKTPLQELIDIINEKRKESDISNTLLRFCVVEAEKLLEKEKQQIIDAFNNGMNNSEYFFTPNFRECNESEQYYHETYNNKTDDKN